MEGRVGAAGFPGPGGVAAAGRGCGLKRAVEDGTDHGVTSLRGVEGSVKGVGWLEQA
jgi:hypothetical protein